MIKFAKGVSLGFLTATVSLAVVLSGAGVAGASPVAPQSPSNQVCPPNSRDCVHSPGTTAKPPRGYKVPKKPRGYTIPKIPRGY